jgi:hypothetical protein
MARIKFVLWERYRAWWGAHQLNEQDPLLLDRVKIEEEEEKRAKMTKRKLEELEAKRRRALESERARRGEARLREQEAKAQAAKEEEELKEYQRLAAGGGPDAPKPE